MLLPDPSIDATSLAHLLATEFGAKGLTPTFVPAGGDSWSYRAGPWWVSVRRDRQGHFPANYEAARELRDAGYEFVLAPVRGRSGNVVHSVSGRPVVVTEFVESRANYRDGLSPVHRQELSRAVKELHSARVSAEVRSEAFDLPFADELEMALARAVAGSHAAGPLGSDVSELVSRNAARISDWREEIAVCQDRCRAASGELVLTHGEPEPPNVIITPGDELLLLDWGDLLRAPPERDALSLRSLDIAPPARRDFCASTSCAGSSPRLPNTSRDSRVRMSGMRRISRSARSWRVISSDGYHASGQSNELPEVKRSSSRS